MFGFLRKSQSNTNQPGGAGSGSNIRYDASLIGKLKSDHVHLLTLFGAVKVDFEAGKHSSAAEKLDQFGKLLYGHLLAENVRLYIYLKHMLARDEISYGLAHNFRREMDEIGRITMAFLDKYKAIGVDKDLSAHFGSELENIGKVLVDRIAREEDTLYPLYLPIYGTHA